MALTFTYAGKRLSERVTWAYFSPSLPWVIIGLAIVLRLVQYAYNPSLNFDEAGVALNIVNRSLSGLREPLDYVQNAPLGFLVLENLLVKALGNSEFTLRLFPLVLGVASLFLFYEAAKQFLKPQAVPIALLIFAIAQPLIQVTAQAKQYSGDVAIALLLLLLTVHILTKGLAARWLVLYGIVGGLALWFSYPAVFMLAGLGSTLALGCYSRKDWAKLAQLTAVGTVWLVSFGLTLSSTTGTVSQVFDNAGVVERLSPLFLPFPPTSLSDIEWYIRTALQTFKQPGGMFFPGIAAFVFLTGCAALYSENRVKFFLLITPLLFTLLASALGRYPLPGPDALGARFSLFLVPVLLLLIGAGAQFFIDRVMPTSKPLAIAFLAFVCFSPVLSTAEMLSSPRSGEEMRPIVSHIRNGWEDGDTILVLRTQPGFEYYAEKFGFSSKDYVIATETELEKYLCDVQGQVTGTKLWAVYGHATDPDFADAQKMLTQCLNTIGMKIDSLVKPGVVLELYAVGPAAAGGH